MFWVRLSDQALIGSSHLSLVEEPYKYSLGVKVSITFWCNSCLSPLEKESLSFFSSITHTLERQDYGSNHQTKDLGYLRPSDFFFFFMWN